MANNTNDSKKYISLTRLSTFLDNLTNKFAALSHKHTTADLTDYKVDTALSPTSNNPVANSTLDAEFDAIATAMGALETAIDGKANASHTHAISDVTNLQSSLDTKQATITGAATTIASSNLTASRALVSNGSGKVAVSAVTSTELGYLDGVTSNIQTQLDGKAASSHVHSEYMTVSNPTGTGSFSLNRVADTTIGNYSFAEGRNNTASGLASHAEGDGTTASAQATHAEGSGTTASSWYAHAEGWDTTASARAAHAEGNTTVAKGQQSHAEGFYTVAASTSQHVQGKHNIEDANNVYAHIVGNGSSDAKSNAHTLDWDGNAWFAGDVYVGGAGQNEGTTLVKSTDLDNYLPLTGGTMTGILYTSASTPLFIGENGKVGMRARVADKNNVGQINISNAWYNNGNQWGAQISAYNGEADGYNELRISHNGLEYNCEDGNTYQVLHSNNYSEYLDEAIGTKANASDLTTHTSNKSNPHGVTAEQVGAPTIEQMDAAIAAIPTPDVSGQINEHNTASDAHADIRDIINDHATSKDNPHGVTLSQLGVTATAAELNVLDGITATATELNYVDGVTSNIQTQLNKKANDFSLEIYNGTSGNPKPVKFATVNYSTCTSEAGVAIKLGLVSGHGNGSSYAFLEDAIIKVGYTGNVSVDNFKYYGAAVTDNGVARQYGDIFWVIDTTNKIVDFYCLMGQYARLQMTPYKRVTYSTGGTITQYTSCTVYSSGDKVWGNNSDIALKSDFSGIDFDGYATTDALNTLQAQVDELAANVITVYSGTEAPLSIVGEEGDIYLYMGE